MIRNNETIPLRVNTDEHRFYLIYLCLSVQMRSGTVSYLSLILSDYLFDFSDY